MPDWSYRTLSQPVLFRLPAEKARDFTLGLMGKLCRLPLGPAFIDLLGHMWPDPRVARNLLGVTFPAPVGLGPGLDTKAVALPALARFGIGFIEVGPVTLAGGAGKSPLERRADRQAIWRSEPGASLSLGEALSALREMEGTGVPLIVHVAAAAGATPEQALAEFDHIIPRLAEVSEVLALEGLPDALRLELPPDVWRRQVEHVITLARAGEINRPVLVVVPADADTTLVEPLLAAAIEAGAGGFLVDGSMRAEPGGRLYGLPVLALALQQVAHLRGRWPALAVIGAGGVHEPEHALEMLAAGADLVSTDTGLIFSGPGLPKRINEAILYAQSKEERSETYPARPAERSWFWTMLMGLGMLIGSLMALVIAATLVVLPYDEQFAGMTRAELQALNPRLLAFLAHDRVSLAGSMTAIGVMYLGLSVFGIRRGMRWAQLSVFCSAFVGFATFFLFLGYGYLDTFHAFVTAVLLQFLLLGLHSPLGPQTVPESPALHDDARWRMSLWGQLILIGHAAAVITAGLVIAGFGVTRVFVPEDLEFMRTTAEALLQANPRLKPLIAHDRATFGGMLVSGGLVLLLSALWGFRPSSAWLWWTQLVGVALAYAAAIAVHMVVGYTNLWHLTPAYGGLAVFLLGLGLSYPFLCHAGASAAEWKRFKGMLFAAGRLS